MYLIRYNIIFHNYQFIYSLLYIRFRYDVFGYVIHPLPPTLSVHTIKAGLISKG